MKDLTQGDIFRNLITFSLPLFIANLLQTTYNIVDTIWVGRLGSTSLAAVSMSFVIVFVVFSVVMGITAATAALVAQHFGARKREMAPVISANSFTFATMVSLLLTTLLLFTNRHVLTFLGTPEEAMPEAVAYLNIILLGMPLMYGFFVVASILRGAGDSVTPMKFMIATNLLNLVADPLLIFGIGPLPALGVVGAAWATVLSRGFALIWGLVHMQKVASLRMSWSHFRPNWDLVARLSRIGFPAAVGGILTSLAATALIALVAPFGTVPVAAHGIGLRIDSLIIMPAVALGMGAAVVIGQNLGAGERERAYSGGLLAQKLITASMTVVGILLFLGAPWVVAVFSPGQHEVIAMGTTYLRIISLSYGFFGLIITTLRTLEGAGDTVATMTLTFIVLWIFRLPLAYYLSRGRGLGAPGVWSGVLAGNLLGGMAMHGYFRLRWWMNRVVVRRVPGPPPAAETAVALATAARGTNPPEKDT